MSYKFDEYKVEEILESNDIVDVIEEFFPLKKAGANYIANCPFHNEKTPSFVVSKQKQIYKCFGCGKAGNVSKFIMDYRNMDFFEALEFLARRSGVQLEKFEGDKSSKIEFERKKLFEINRAAARFFYENLKKNKLAYGYLQNREIDNEIITRFGVGYATAKWDDLLLYLTKLGYKDTDIEKVGLIKKSQKTGRYYDVLRNRIIFPIINVKKQVIGFGARILEGEGPKYINSSESMIYHKKDNLYGINIAREKVRDEYFYLVEGYMDVIKMHAYGFETAVAALGTSLTLEQIKLLKRYSKKFYICFDSDKAGLNAALRAINMFKQCNLDPKVIIVEDAKDPDEYLNKHSVVEFKALANKAKGYYDFLEFYYKDVFKNSTKAEYIYNIFENLININNDIEREIFLDKLSKKVKVTKESLYNEFVKKHKKEIDIKYKKPVKQEKKHERRVRVNRVIEVSIESEILKYIAKDNALILRLQDMFTDDFFEDYEYIDLFKCIYNYYIEHQKIDKNFIIDLVGEKFDIMSVLDEIEVNHIEMYFDETYKKLKCNVYEKYRLKLNDSLKMERDNSRKIKIAKDMQDCSKKILKLN